MTDTKHKNHSANTSRMKFYQNRLSGFRAVRGQKWGPCINFNRRPYNTTELPVIQTNIQDRVWVRVNISNTVSGDSQQLESDLGQTRVKLQNRKKLNAILPSSLSCPFSSLHLPIFLFPSQLHSPSCEVAISLGNN